MICLLLLCACSSISVVNGFEIKVEPCEWSYENGKETINAIAGEIGKESDAWNELYFTDIVIKQNQGKEPKYMIFNNNRVAVIYNWSQSSGKIINVKDFYPDQFKILSDEITFSKNGLNFDISKNERYTMMSSPVAGTPIYVFDNEKGVAKNIIVAPSKRAFFIDDLLYIELVVKNSHTGLKDYTVVLYDPQSGKIVQEQYTERNEPEPPDLNEYTNIGDISSNIDSFTWDGTISKDVITELNNANPYKVQLYLYNTTDKTYCTEIINVFDLLQ